jgi:hypothetical protein
MAKIGYLFLHGGIWEGRQIISRAWVDAAVQKQHKVPNGNWYGYGWWISGDGAGTSFFAEGNGGQVINVNPGYNSVVVTTGGGFTYDDVIAVVLAAFIDPESPLPANPEGVAELEEALSTLPQSPAPQAALVLPATAYEISGKTYQLDENPASPASGWILTIRPRRVSRSPLRMAVRARSERWDWMACTASPLA